MESHKVFQIWNRELHMVQINSSNYSIKFPNYSTGIYADQSLFKQWIEKYLKVRGSILSTLLGNLGVVNGTLNTVDLESIWDKLSLMGNYVIKVFLQRNERLQVSVHSQGELLHLEKSVFSLVSNAIQIADESDCDITGLMWFADIKMHYCKDK